MGQHLLTSREVDTSAIRSHLTGTKLEDGDVRDGWGDSRKQGGHTGSSGDKTELATQIGTN